MAWTRRGLLTAIALTAGCTTPADDAETRATATRTTADDLDLREANVVDVEWEGEPGGDVRVSVTLFHDDDGEAGYANWWQVETLGGERLGRRKLLHPHSTAPFTRSETVRVPTEIACVVLRGHDQTHGYGGRVMLVNLDSGATLAVEQGSERQAFTDADCP